MQYTRTRIVFGPSAAGACAGARRRCRRTGTRRRCCVPRDCSGRSDDAEPASCFRCAPAFLAPPSCGGVPLARATQILALLPVLRLLVRCECEAASWAWQVASPPTHGMRVAHSGPERRLCPRISSSSFCRVCSLQWAHRLGSGSALRTRAALASFSRLDLQAALQVRQRICSSEM